MRIAFIGHGNVGAALADGLQRAGHEVTLATERPNSASAQAALARNPRLETATPARAVQDAEVVFLATPYAANAEALGAVREQVAGKVLVDCTNPVGPGLRHGLGSAKSGAEEVASLAPGASVVKAFTIYGYENFEDNRFPGSDLKPAMLYCGHEKTAKAVVAQLIGDLGWEPVDVGGMEQALHLEHMTLLWIRMVRVHGASPHFVWAALRR